MYQEIRYRNWRVFTKHIFQKMCFTYKKPRVCIIGNLKSEGRGTLSIRNRWNIRSCELKHCLDMIKVAVTALRFFFPSIFGLILGESGFFKKDWRYGRKLHKNNQKCFPLEMFWPILIWSLFFSNCAKFQSLASELMISTDEGV